MMISGRFQSIRPEGVKAYREKQIETERKRRPMYGLGTHVKGNKKPFMVNGGHHFLHAERVRGLKKNEA